MALPFFAACSADVSRWSDAEIDAWCEESDFFNFEESSPDAGLDRREYVSQCLGNPDEWKAAAEFLKRQDLASLEDGRYELSSAGTYANVQRYRTKSEAQFEVHRKYVDVQFLMEGRELIEVAPLEAAGGQTLEYDESRDIAFYAKADSSYFIKACPRNFAILFPSDAHKPCLSDGEESEVMKIVVKIPYAD